MGNAKSSEVRIASEVSPKTNAAEAHVIEHSDGHGCTNEPIPPFRCPTRPLGSSGRGEPMVCVSRFERFVRAGAATRHARRSTADDMRCDEGRRERSPVPQHETKARRGSCLCQPVFPLSSGWERLPTHGITTICRYAPLRDRDSDVPLPPLRRTPGWVVGGPRDDAPTRSTTGHCKVVALTRWAARASAATSAKVAPARAATSWTESNSGMALSPPPGNVAILIATFP